ncbi:MAG: ABC transporter ATP-binding protein [Treponemataceae bacterium]|nr:MAG: ABC transporter ATP-binding protein [Treponemataceae bacterium]
MLEVNNLTVRYNPDDSVPALNEISFSLRDGEKIALIGNNGAGKSTLLLTLVGILLPESGSVVVDGIALNKNTVNEIRGKIGLVMQNPDDQLFMPTVFDDIAFGPRAKGIAEPLVEQKVDGVMSRLGIAPLKTRLTHRLSGGEKRLAALAGILVTEPSIMLFDEPATFLDPPARARLIDILCGLSQSMIIATHDLDLAAKLCSRELLLERGRLGRTED